MKAPTTRDDFDAAYRAPLTPWGDIRIPTEVKALAARYPAGKVLELGCGLGRFSQYVAEQGLIATGVDFSPVAIDKARARSAGKPKRATYLTADVTRLDVPGKPFDAAFDVGCFHCLDAAGQASYSAGVARHLKPGAILLIWTMDAAPSVISLSPAVVEPVFEQYFRLVRAQACRRRFAASHWFWFERRNA